MRPQSSRPVSPDSLPGTHPSRFRRQIIAAVGGLLSLILTGCCGIESLPAVLQAKAWMAQGAPPGTSAAAATEFLESKGFRVFKVLDEKNVHELRADKKIGKCYLNFTYDKLYIYTTLDSSECVVDYSVYLGVSPGI
jgi:hypothetical protein